MPRFITIAMQPRPTKPRQPLFGHEESIDQASTAVRKSQKPHQHVDMMLFKPRQAKSNIAATRVAVLLVPIIIVGIVGYATWAIIDHLCVDYLIRKHNERGTAIAFIVLYAVLFPLTFAPWLRVNYSAHYNAGLVPWTEWRQDEEVNVQERLRIQRRNKSWRERFSQGSREEDIPARPWNPPDTNPDSPGLEQFYSKQVFVCEADGRPKWCSECQNWKPDRAHHSSELGHCVRKMDHLCPWVGGMISETSFNFFFQFTFFATMYCSVCLCLSAYCLAKQRQEGKTSAVTISVLALAAFLGFFTFGMTSISSKFVFTNTTNIDLLRKEQRHTLAFRVPLNSPSTPASITITYPLQNHAPEERVPSRQWAPPSAPHADDSTQRDSGSTLVSRDQQAQRTFTVVQFDSGENPWDLGYWRNFKSVMGNNIFEWLLPIRHSPCCNHDSMFSDYEMSRRVNRMAAEYLKGA